EELQLEVIEFDKESKKIILAAQAPAEESAAEEPEDDAYQQYIIGSDMDEPPTPLPPTVDQPSSGKEITPPEESPTKGEEGEEGGEPRE
ncbi:hypothetical protein KJ815_11000, partial [bacterium]|nr:hypothetical protein [bacterium]